MLIEEFCEHTEKKITGMEIDSTMVEAQKVVNKVAINQKQVFLVSLRLKRIEGGEAGAY